LRIQSTTCCAVIPVFLSSATRPYGFERAQVELKLAAVKIYRSGARPRLSIGASYEHAQSVATAAGG
jgi:hypothetical protein